MRLELNKQWKWLLGITLLLSGLWFWRSYGAFESATSSLPPAENTAAVTNPAVPMPLDLPKPNARVGSQQIYNLSHVSIGDFDFSNYFSEEQSTGLHQKLRIEFQGTISRTVLDQGPGVRFVVQFQPQRFLVLVNDDFAPQLEQALRQGLEQTVEVRQTRVGLIQEIRLARSLPIEAQDYLVSLLKKLEWPSPDAPVNEGYMVTQTDMNGVYEAYYSRLESDESDLVKLRKERQQFLNLNFKVGGDFGKQDIRAVTEGGFTYTIAMESGLLRSIQGEETILYLGEANQPIGENRDMTELHQKSQRLLTENELNDLRLLLEQRQQAFGRYADNQKDAEQQRLRRLHDKNWGSSQISEVFMALESLDSLQGDKRQQLEADLFVKLRAFSFLFPDQLSTVADFLSRLDPSHPGFETALAALVNISNVESQAVIADLLRDSIDDPPRLEAALPAAGFVKRPQAFLERAIEQLVHSGPTPLIRDMAELAKGVLAGELMNAAGLSTEDTERQEFEQRFQDIESELLERLQSSTQKDELLQILATIGNFGSLKALPILKRLLQQPDEDIRSQVVMSIRFLDFSNAQTLLEQARQHSSRAVDKAIASSLSYMPASQDKFDFEQSWIHELKDPSVQIQLLDNLYRARYFGEARLRALLQGFAASATDENLQNYAQGLLNQWEFES